MAKRSFCYPTLHENIIDGDDWHKDMGRTFEELLTNTMQCQGYSSWSSEVYAGDTPTIFSSKTHRQAEKRRRDRINAQLSKLRNFIPNSQRMDKATLLERVVEQVQDLKRKASQTSQFLTIPTEVDDVSIECHHYTNIQQRHPNTHNNNNNNNDNKDMLIKVTICCEDRPDIIPEFVRAIKSLNLITIEANIACLGGRMKSILVLCSKDSDENGVFNANFVKQSLLKILTRVISWSTSTPNFRVISKRQRFFFSS